VLIVNANDTLVGQAGTGRLLVAGVNVPATPVNVIAANLGVGVQVTGRAQGTKILGNYFGVDAKGAKSLNPADTIDIWVYDTSAVSSNTQIGGTEAGSGNLIAGGAGTTGVVLTGPLSKPGGNSVLGNLIGLLVSGSTFVASGQDTGVQI